MSFFLIINHEVIRFSSSLPVISGIKTNDKYKITLLTKRKEKRKKKIKPISKINTHKKKEQKHQKIKQGEQAKKDE